MVNFGPLTADIGSGVWGTPANFNRFRVLALLLQQRRSPEASQTLNDVWPSPRLLHYIHIFRALAPGPNGILPGSKFTLRASLAFTYIGNITARHSSSVVQRASVKLCGVVQGMELPNVRRGRHLYLDGRPSRWASAHILVFRVL